MTSAERAEARAEAAEARMVRPAKALPATAALPPRRASVEERCALLRGPAGYGGREADPPEEYDPDGRIARSWGY